MPINDPEKKIAELEGEILRLKLDQAAQVRTWWKDMMQMLMNFLSPALMAYVAWLGYQTNNKLDENKVDRTRIETKLDEVKEETKTGVLEARSAVERANETAENVKVGTEEIKTAVAKLRPKMVEVMPEETP